MFGFPFDVSQLQIQQLFIVGAKEQSRDIKRVKVVSRVARRKAALTLDLIGGELGADSADLGRHHHMAIIVPRYLQSWVIQRQPRPIA